MNFGDVASELQPNTTYRYKLERPEFANKWSICLFAMVAWGFSGFTIRPAGGWKSNGILEGNIITGNTVNERNDMNYIIVGMPLNMAQGHNLKEWEDAEHPFSAPVLDA